MDLSGTTASVSGSSLSELVWSGPDGPDVRGVVALVRDDVPVVAFTYAAERVARQVAAADAVALVVRETRSTGRAFRPLVVHGHPHLVEDPDGAVFRRELLDQELRRFPPARVLADSPLLRREHWWYLPRLLLEIRATEVVPLPDGAGEGRPLLVSQRHGRLEPRPVAVRDGDPGRPVVDGPAPEDGTPCVLFGQDASFPDLERWNQWSRHGVWREGGLVVEHEVGTPGLGPAPGLLRRWRDQHRLARACRQALSAAERP